MVENDFQSDFCDRNNRSNRNRLSWLYYGAAVGVSVLVLVKFKVIGIRHAAIRRMRHTVYIQMRHTVYIQMICQSQRHESRLEIS